MLCHLTPVTKTNIHRCSPHSWFISVVNSNELYPGEPVQVNQSKYENDENDGAIRGHDVFFEHKYSFTVIFFWNSMRAAHCHCVLQVLQKVQRGL